MEIQRSLFKQEVVAYYRRSQDKKGQQWSIQRQQDQVRAFCEAQNLLIIAEHQDTESGRADERKGLLAAVSQARKSNIPLVILSVDRLSRKLSTLASYFEDNSLTIYIAQLGMKADLLTISLLSCIAAAETRTLSKRTKEGLAAAKARGVKLGNPQWEQAVPKAAEARKAQGEATVKKYGDLIVSLRDSGLSFMNIKHRLNDLGIPTPTGKRRVWTKGSVYAIYKRTKNL